MMSLSTDIVFMLPVNYLQRAGFSSIFGNNVSWFPNDRSVSGSRKGEGEARVVKAAKYFPFLKSLFVLGKTIPEDVGDFLSLIV